MISSKVPSNIGMPVWHVCYLVPQLHCVGFAKGRNAHGCRRIDVTFVLVGDVVLDRLTQLVESNPFLL